MAYLYHRRSTAFVEGSGGGGHEAPLAVTSSSGGRITSIATALDAQSGAGPDAARGRQLRQSVTLLVASGPPSLTAVASALRNLLTACAVNATFTVAIMALRLLLQSGSAPALVAYLGMDAAQQLAAPTAVHVLPPVVPPGIRVAIAHGTLAEEASAPLGSPRFLLVPAPEMTGMAPAGVGVPLLHAGIVLLLLAAVAATCLRRFPAAAIGAVAVLLAWDIACATGVADALLLAGRLSPTGGLVTVFGPPVPGGNASGMGPGGVPVPSPFLVATRLAVDAALAWAVQAWASAGRRDWVVSSRRGGPGGVGGGSLGVWS